MTGDRIEIQLGEKHTDCLAKAKCGIDGSGCGSPAREDVEATNAVTSACC
jgi:hypothetical protein